MNFKWIQAKQYSEQIISGHQLPKKNRERSKTNSILDPYVKVNIFGVHADRQEQKTDFIENNGGLQHLLNLYAI